MRLNWYKFGFHRSISKGNLVEVSHYGSYSKDLVETINMSNTEHAPEVAYGCFRSVCNAAHFTGRKKTFFAASRLQFKGSI